MKSAFVKATTSRPLTRVRPRDVAFASQSGRRMPTGMDIGVHLFSRGVK